jgi:hypothetical protein
MAPGGGVRRIPPPISGKLSQCGGHAAGKYKTGLLSLTPEGNCARELIYPTNHILVRIFNGRFFLCPAVRAVGRVHAGICCMSRNLLLHVALRQDTISKGAYNLSNANLYRIPSQRRYMNFLTQSSTAYECSFMHHSPLRIKSMKKIQWVGGFDPAGPEHKGGVGSQPPLYDPSFTTFSIIKPWAVPWG